MQSFAFVFFLRMCGLDGEGVRWWSFWQIPSDGTADRVQGSSVRPATPHPRALARKTVARYPRPALINVPSLCLFSPALVFVCVRAYGHISLCLLRGVFFSSSSLVHIWTLAAASHRLYISPEN